MKEESAETESERGSEATKFPPILITRYWIKSSRRGKRLEGVAKSTKFTTVRMEDGRGRASGTRGIPKSELYSAAVRVRVRRPSFQFKSSKKFPRASYSSPAFRTVFKSTTKRQDRKGILEEKHSRSHICYRGFGENGERERERDRDDMEEEEPLQPFLRRRQRRLSVRNERSRQRRQRPRRTTPTKEERKGKSGPK